MEKKTCLITGATSGIGKAAALALGRKGYSLILTGRNSVRGSKISDTIKRRFQNPDVQFFPADISSIKDVLSLTEKLKSQYSCIDVLINNAGARFDDYKKSLDGIELTFATNYLGPFVLTNQLLSLLEKSSSGRIVNVASSAHGSQSNDFSQAAHPAHYNRKIAYGKSKLANILFTYELSEKLKDKRISVNAVDPGGVLTSLGRNNGIIPWIKHILYYVSRRSLISPGKGAETIIYLADSSEMEGISGKYFYKKQEIKSSKESYDKEAAVKLWDRSLSLCGIRDFTTK